jgi:hypothetical protein
MPTNINEAIHISKIINDYIGPVVASQLTNRLYEEVGKTTENESLRVSLQMLKDLYNPKEKP